DCGVDLTLWGNLPEFSNFPPLLESVVMLNLPDEGRHADLTLDRGRIQLALAAGKGARQVRLRFLREVWDLVLADADSKVCAELWQSPLVGPGRYLGLFTRGKVTVKTGRKEWTFTSPARVAWSSEQPTQPFDEKLKDPPDWWDKAPAANPQTQDVVLSLNDW